MRRIDLPSPSTGIGSVVSVYRGGLLGGLMIWPVVSGLVSTVGGVAAISAERACEVFLVIMSDELSSDQKRRNVEMSKIEIGTSGAESRVVRCVVVVESRVDRNSDG